MKIYRLCILFALWLPVSGMAQTVFETQAGFVSSTFATDVSPNRYSLEISNMTAMAHGVLSSDGSSNNIAGWNGNTHGSYNPVAVKCNAKSAVTIAFFINMAAINNSADIYHNILYVSFLTNSGNSGFFINVTSNKFLVGGRSRISDSFQSVSTPAYVLSNRYTHLAAVYNYAATSISVYVDGALAVSSNVAFGTNALVAGINNANQGIRDTVISYSFDRSYSSKGKISPLLVVSRAWTLADVNDDRRRRGKAFVNP